MGKIAGIKRIPVTTLNLNRRSLFYEAYLGDWEVLALRVLAAPVYIIIFGICVWGVVGPTMFVRSRFRRSRANHVLVKNGIDLKNPSIIAMKERLGSFGKDDINIMIHRIDAIVNDAPLEEIYFPSDEITLTQEEKIASTEEKIALTQEELTQSRLLQHDQPLRPKELSRDDRRKRLKARAEEDMLNAGILSREDDKWKINETVLQALTVLAKAFDTKPPNSGGSSEAKAVTDDRRISANGERV